MSMLMFTLSLLLSLACAPPEAPADLLPAPAADLALPPPASWPDPEAPLTLLQAPAAEPLRVFLDPGHGARGNSGNSSCLCIDEQDHNLRVAQHLAASLETAGHLVRLARQEGEQVSYGRRLGAASRWDADLLISLHSDARGAPGTWEPREGLSCTYNDGEEGFSVLWSDEGAEALVASRRALARALAGRMVQAGFSPYDGYHYAHIYLGDAEHPGVFLDRHQPRRRIRMLRRPTMPSVIIETHHAWDRREETRWQEAPTLEAFDAAVRAALAQL